ncbi:hypothetical protein TWF718_011251 [Orbilia javanica]|uniref:Uncharacterized protein n=1 Tax=Orbilia javanica TaxID=47235 RepID=A0AAN8MW16_9PEZI
MWGTGRNNALEVENVETYAWPYLELVHGSKARDMVRIPARFYYIERIDGVESVFE